MKAFVSGGYGFLGRALVAQLKRKGACVQVYDRPQDILDAPALLAGLPEDIDVLFHLAADTSHWTPGNARQRRVNVEGTRNVVQAALQRGVRRLVHTSSIAAYGFHQRRITESTPSTAMRTPINYFQTKRLAELEVYRGIEAGLDAVIINPANILGPEDQTGWRRFFDAVRDGALPGVPPGEASWCYVLEVAKAHISAAERGVCGEHYLLGGADASFAEFAQTIAKALNKRAPYTVPAFVPRWIARLSDGWSRLSKEEPMLTSEKALLLSSRLVCDSTKAIQTLDYAPLTLQRMVEEVLMKDARKG